MQSMMKMKTKEIKEEGTQNDEEDEDWEEDCWTWWWTLMVMMMMTFKCNAKVCTPRFHPNEFSFRSRWCSKELIMMESATWRRRRRWTKHALWTASWKVMQRTWMQREENERRHIHWRSEPSTNRLLREFAQVRWRREQLAKQGRGQGPCTLALRTSQTFVSKTCTHSKLLKPKKLFKTF